MAAPAIAAVDWRTVIPKVVDCKARYFCPSCHAKRLARWSLWLDETPPAP